MKIFFCFVMMGFVVMGGLAPSPAIARSRIEKLESSFDRSERTFKTKWNKAADTSFGASRKPLENPYQKALMDDVKAMMAGPLKGVDSGSDDDTVSP